MYTTALSEASAAVAPAWAAGGALAQASSFGTRAVNYYLTLLATPAGIAAVAGFLVLACVALVVRSSRAAWAAAAFYLAPMSQGRGEYSDPLTPPFAQLGAVAQPLTYGLIVLLLISAVGPAPEGRRVRPPLVLWALLLFQVALSARYVVGGFPEKGLVGLATFAALFVALGLGFGKWAAGEQRYASLARTMAAGAVVLLVTAAAQYAISPDAALVSGRLAGTTANGNRLAYGLAVTIPFTLFLATAPSGGRPGRAAWFAVLAATLLAIAATGSRGGALTVLVALAAYFRTRLGPAVVVGLGLAILVFAGLAVASDDLFRAARRLTATADTRGEVWAQLVATFLAHPLIGIDAEGALGESSYLSVAAGMGLVGLAPLGVLLWAIGRTILACVRRRRQLGPARGLADLVVSGLSAMLAIWFVEGYLFSFASDVLIALYALIAVAAVVTADEVPAAADVPVTDPGAAPGAELGWA